jgi:hypothetical protein
MELPTARIREYDPTTDYPALRKCFIELQAWEQSFEPGLPAPEEAADPYLAEVFRNCALGVPDRYELNGQARGVCPC